MLATLDIAALLAGVGLVWWSGRRGARSPACERLGGAAVVVALIGIGLLLARSAG